MKVRLLILSVLLFKTHICWGEDITERDSEDNLDDPAVNFKINYIYPGTKWCGAGDIAKNYNDLGSQRKTDKCCRAHDHCSDIIAAGETKYNLTNTASYTRLNCDCDDTFYNCLKSVDKKSAKIIGNIYFNTLHTKCFKKEYLVKKCAKKTGLIHKKCLKYVYDTKSKKKYQWFDVKEF